MLESDSQNKFEHPRIRAIIGLGNPGPEYLRTRHNLGFWFVDALASGGSEPFSLKRRLHAEVAKLYVDEHDIVLAKPNTYMNRSGLALRAIKDYFHYEPQELLVAHDDLDLAVGEVKLKRSGGHGGHNGLRDIIRTIGSDFVRLRFGIGHPRGSKAVLDYVLGIPSKAEESLLVGALQQGLAQVPRIVEGNISAAMQSLHTPRVKD